MKITAYFNQWLTENKVQLIKNIVDFTHVTQLQYHSLQLYKECLSAQTIFRALKQIKVKKIQSTQMCSICQSKIMLEIKNNESGQGNPKYLELSSLLKNSQAQK